MAIATTPRAPRGGASVYRRALAFGGRLLYPYSAIPKLIFRELLSQLQNNTGLFYLV